MNFTDFHIHKDRLVSLMDAVLAIIMTILVLSLDGPESPTLEGFWALRNSYFAYALSFFWIGILWLALNQVFSMITRVDGKIMIIGLMMLFVCSLVPYLTMLSSDYFYSCLVQTLFALCTGIVNILFACMIKRMEVLEGNLDQFQSYGQKQCRKLWISFGVKLVGVLICWIIWPPAGMCSIILSAILSVLIR